MITIEARANGRGELARTVAEAALVLWRSRRFSTADIGELLSVSEAKVTRLVSVPALEVSA